MNERKIILITIVGTCGFVVLLVAFVLTILLLKRRCRKSKTLEADRNSIATTITLDEGLTNLTLDDDGLVSATKQRTPEVRAKPKRLDTKQGTLETIPKTTEGLDPRFEEMLDNAYADARQFAKFPHMP